jgi:predicted O-methyltransferase YrrM
MKKLINYPRIAARKIKRALSRSEDIYSLNSLQSLLIDYPYLPMSFTALRPLGIALILNEIIVNQRQFILEFGSGISTILISRLIKKNQLSTQFVSVEYDANWYRLIQAQLKSEEAPSSVQIIHAPLLPCDFALNGLEWFNQQILKDYFQQLDGFDMVIIDGPLAGNKKLQFSRYPALPFIWDKLKPEFVIILDDADRYGEKKIITLWEKLYPLKFRVVGDNIALAYCGKHYFASPQPIDTLVW